MQGAGGSAGATGNRAGSGSGAGYGSPAPATASTAAAAAATNASSAPAASITASGPRTAGDPGPTGPPSNGTSALAASRAPGTVNPAAPASNAASSSSSSTVAAAPARPRAPSGVASGAPVVSTPAAAKPATASPAATAAPPAAAPAPRTNTNAPNATRPLNVKDALSYLDQVKVQFERQPRIYNQFLDIMKDFKTQQIDTPGVIDRVSSLFRSHPGLISGFNLFLPAGFRIECTTDPDNGGAINSITVTTPTGQVKKDLPVLDPTGQAAPPANRPPMYGARPAASINRPPVPALGAAAAAKSAAPLASAPAGPARSAAPFTDVKPTVSAQAVKTEAGAGARPTTTPASAAATSKSQTAAAQQPSATTSQPQASASAAGTRNSTPTAASTLSESKTGRPPIEFNHAISYVNKIKNRFIRDPEIYKSFLDILQTYQKEQRPIQDVYAQVTRLFKSAPDLLDEFKQFLPDNSQQSQQQAQQQQQQSASLLMGAGEAAAADKQKKGQGYTAAALHAAVERGSGKTKPNVPGQTIQTPEEVPAATPPATSQAGKRKRPAPGGIDTAVAAASSAPSPAAASAATPTGTAPPGKGKAKRGKAAPAGVKDPPTVAQQSSVRQDPTAAPAPPSSGINGGASYPPPILSYLPPGYTLPGSSGTGPIPQGPPPTAQETVEEKQFFDRIAAYIDDKPTYLEFLKLLNLYTQDIIDLPTLVSRAWLFIGTNTELWMDFREIVGWRDNAVGDPNHPTHGLNASGRVIENGEWVIENVPAVEKRGPDLTRAETAGPSYKRLPPHERQMNCSGRDSLCWEVLNDEWVSVMSLGTEEVFLAHRKNVFEEALHRTEEERHEYDYHIEANLRTIALLEPIATKIASMEPEDRMTFRLKPGLGGQSKSIYQRVIKKVYGKDLGREVIQALHENPCVSVPIVLARLKQKDEEWKRALREWNRVWREVDAKNFYRSLDHQGIAFKAQDKRYIASKALVHEIETLRRTQMQKQIAAPPNLRPPAATYQLAFPISDENVLFDSLKLFLSYLDRAPGYHTMPERDRIEAFLRSLTSLVFAIPVSVLDSMLTPVLDEEAGGSTSEDGDMSDSAASSVDGSLHPSTSGSRRGGSSHQTAAAKKAADLRKKAMKNATGEGGGRRGRKDAGDATPASSRDSTPAPVAAPVQDPVQVQAPTPTPAPVTVSTPTPVPAVVLTAQETAAKREGTPMADLHPTTESDAQAIVEQSSNGESSYNREVPASAAGLDGMQGVETVQPKQPTPPEAAASAVPAPNESTEGSAAAAAPAEVAPPTIAVDQPAVPSLEPVQTASSVITNGPTTAPITSTSSEGSGSAGAPSPTTPGQTIQPNGQATPVLQQAQPKGEHQLRRFNFFCNTPYYCAIRLLQLLYSRLHIMKDAARALGSTTAKDAVTNTAYTAFGKANPRFAGQEATSPVVLYENMLELCEKLFGSEIDQGTFEDGVRALFGNKAYHIYTIDKVLSALVKTVWSLIDSNREAYSSNGEIFKLLVDDRRYPTTAQAQQISYRINAELAAGSEENLYRIEWMPRRHLITFQLLGKDELLPEDEKDLSKLWERYIESYIGDEVTKELAIDPVAIAKGAYVRSNLRNRRHGLPQLYAKSQLESRICMRSYKMFWQAGTEDAMHRAWAERTDPELEKTSMARSKRFAKWLEGKESSWTGAIPARHPQHQVTSPALQSQGPASRNTAAPVDEMMTDPKPEEQSRQLSTPTSASARVSAEPSTSVPAPATASAPESAAASATTDSAAVSGSAPVVSSAVPPAGPVQPDAGTTSVNAKQGEAATQPSSSSSPTTAKPAEPVGAGTTTPDAAQPSEGSKPVSESTAASTTGTKEAEGRKEGEDTVMADAA